jgi:hypothetical protein
MHPINQLIVWEFLETPHLIQKLLASFIYIIIKNECYFANFLFPQSQKHYLKTGTIAMLGFASHPFI